MRTSAGFLVLTTITAGLVAPGHRAAAREAEDASTLGTCSGVVFLDLDADGDRREALVRGGEPRDLEPGVEEVEVTIVDRAGRATTTRTDPTGRWRRTIHPDRFPVRITVEPPPGLSESVVGPTNGTGTQFVTDPVECDRGSVGLLDPGSFCDADAAAVIACHARRDVRDATPDEPAIRLVAPSVHDTGRTDSTTDGAWLSEPIETLATVGEVGTVHGLATTPDGRVFAAAFVKRHTTLASELNPTGNPTAIFELGADRRPRRFAIVDPTADDPHGDGDVMADVFRAGIGDLELSADGRRLHAVDLGRRAVVTLDVDDGEILATTPLDGIRLGIDGCGVTAADPFGDLRPFGLGLDRDGDLLIGVVCSAESTVAGTLPIDDGPGTNAVAAGDDSALVGYVFELTGDRFRQRLRWPLAGRRGETSDGDGPAHEAAWHPWVDEYPFTSDHDVVSYPQPAITDLLVGPDGHLVLAIGDRWSHQTAPHSSVPSQAGDRPIDETIAAGDLQRACPDGDGWVIEGTDDCRGGIGDGWEFFHGDRYGWHGETPLGALAAAPGRRDVIATQMNPLPVDGAWHSGGIAWHDTATGDPLDGLRLYDGRNIRPDGTFEHASGVGDVELLCGEPPIVIGGRFWYDADGDGTADATEPPIAGVPLELLDPNGRTIADGRTRPDGRFQFDGRDIARGLDAGKRYTVVVPETALRSGVFGPNGPWTGLRPAEGAGAHRVEIAVVAGDDPSTDVVEPPIRQDLDVAMVDQYDLAVHAALASRDVEVDVVRLDAIVVNQGSLPSGAFAVAARVPPGTELVEAGDGRVPVTVDGDVVTWHVDAARGLAPGASLHLPIRVRVGRRGTTEHEYAVQLVAHDGVDDDSIPGNALLDHPGSLPRFASGSAPVDRTGPVGFEDDAGVLVVRLTTLAGSVWLDGDRDGERDLDPAAAETLVPGVEIRLTRDDGTEFARTTTDGDGWFEFPLLESGRYRVELPASNFDGTLAGYDVIVGPDGSLASASGGFVSSPIVLATDGSDPVTVVHLGIAERAPRPFLGGAGPFLLGPVLIVATWLLLDRQRRRTRYGTP